VEKDELISKVMKEFGTTKNTAQMYYYNWKKEYLNGDIKMVNRNPSARCKHENKKPLTDEMIIDELTKYGFNYLTERTKLAKCIADKFKLEEHTAKFRIDELAEKGKLNSIYAKEKDKVTEVKEVEEPKGPAAIYEKPKSKKLLKIALLQGKTMSYEIRDGGFLLRQKSAVNAIPIDFKDIDDFIAELRELKDVVM
jgi:hypothetical protein